MSRSHARVKKGTEFIDHVPMNWGKNLTTIGAIRQSGWVVLTTMFATLTKNRFVSWFNTKLLPRLRPGDVVVMDNLRAHHDPRIRERQASWRRRPLLASVLPRLQPDRIRVGSSKTSFLKQYVRRCAPRNPVALRRGRAPDCHRVTRKHIGKWFAHCGCGNRSE